MRRSAAGFAYQVGECISYFAADIADLTQAVVQPGIAIPFPDLDASTFRTADLGHRLIDPFVVAALIVEVDNGIGPVRERLYKILLGIVEICLTCLDRSLKEGVEVGSSCGKLLL